MPMSAALKHNKRCLACFSVRLTRSTELLYVKKRSVTLLPLACSRLLSSLVNMTLHSLLSL
jgi:hypothetical protein